MKTYSKRIVSLILVFALLICILPLGILTTEAETVTSGSCGSYLNWTFDYSTSTLTIECTATWSQSISDYSFGKAPWFSFRESIKEVIADKNVSSIGTNAFAGCESLESVYMPGVYRIGDYAFEGCSSLKYVEFSSNYSSSANVGKYAFAYCNSMTKIIIPFRGATIGEKAFVSCGNLNTVGLYSYVNIGDNAFSYCPNLTSIYVIGNRSPLSGTVSNSAFSGVIANVYNSDTSLSTQDRFGGQLTYIKMTSGILGYHAFWDYDQTNEKLIISGEGTLFEFSDGTELPWMVYNYGSGYSSDIKTIIIEDGITEIPSYAFEYMGKVESVSLPNTLLRLYPNAFNDCKSLTEIVIPASVEYVDGKTYWNRCPNLIYAYYVGSEEEWSEVYNWDSTWTTQITPHFLVYHPSTQTCTVAGYPEHYEFDGTSKDTYYDLNKTEIQNPEPSMLEHTFSTDWTADDNSHWHVCTQCGIAVSDIADHIYDNSCDESCNICGHERAIEHSYKGVPSRSATYFHAGYTTGVQCENCGDWLIEPDEIPMLEKEGVFCDVDGDEEVSVLDVTLILRWLADMNIPIELDEMWADVDDDGELTIIDVTLIQRWLANLKSLDRIGFVFE